MFDEVKAIPSVIGDKFSEVGNSIISGLLDGIKGIFIPEPEVIQAKFNGFIDELKMKFGFNTSFFESIFYGDGQPVTDVEQEYDIPGVGTMNLKFFDTKYLVDGITFFRPFIRGFIVLMMLMYNVRMLLSFIGQDAGIKEGKSIALSKKEE